MTTTREDIACLLEAGRNDTAIARELGCDRKTAAKVRAQLGLPRANPGPPPATSIEAVFAARTEPLPGGHTRWTGYRSNRGVPAVRFQGRQVSAFRLAFRLRTGREPDGLVHPTCGMPGCVTPGHVDDQASLNRANALYAAIFEGADDHRTQPSSPEMAGLLMAYERGEDRLRVARVVQARYYAGESIRSLARAGGRSYGYIYGLLDSVGTKFRRPGYNAEFHAKAGAARTGAR